MKIINDIIRANFLKYFDLGFSVLQVQKPLWMEVCKGKKVGENRIPHLSFSNERFKTKYRFFNIFSQNYYYQTLIQLALLLSEIKMFC